MRRQRTKGLGLASVLVLTSLLFSVALVLLGTTLSTRSLVTEQEARTRARHLAEASVLRAIARLHRDPSFGTRPEDQITVTLPGDPAESHGRLTFSGGDLSVNNLVGEAARPGWRDRPVPPNSALLVGVGRSGAREYRVAALLRRSAFPFVVASEGPLVSTGATRVGTLVTAGSTRLSQLSPEAGGELLPGDVASNAALATAIELGPRSWISGDLRAAGGVLLAPSSQVAGRTLPYSDPVALPRIDLNRFDPEQLGLPFQNLPVLLGNEVLTGDSRCSTDLTIQGSLTLEGGTLYVNGNLLVTGGISGSGLVVVRGTTTILGGACLQSERHAVLLSGGDVILRGFRAGASHFHGLVYTEGGFQAEQISLIGTFVARGSKGTLLNAAEVTYDPEVGTLTSSTSSILNPGCVTNATQAQRAGSLSPATGMESDLSLRGSWTSSNGSGTSSPAPGFQLNDFLGQSQPLQLLTWAEEL